jgi:nucleoid DNA-binding protein
MAKKAASKAAETKAAPAPAPAPAPAKKQASAAAPSRGPKQATKAEIYTTLAEKTGLSKKDISSVFDALSDLIGKELGKKGPGLFIVPGLMKLKVVRKPATKERQGKNPFTGEPMTIKAKPARNVVRVQPLKALKDLV